MVAAPDPHAGPAPVALCLVGPTASGKSALAMALAAQVPLEIVSIDSALVYRGMDIGTAKPTAAERAAVPHHLIDILEPTGAYSAARFVADAERLVAEIHARGRLALLTGGTMLYLKALQGGLDPMPAADPALRAQIEADAEARGWPALHAELAQVDPVTAARLAPADAQRIQRALEVHRASGIALSDWQRQSRGSAERQPATAASAWPIVSLEPLDRAWLHRRIAHRFDAMLSMGLVDEVRSLRARGDLRAELPAMRCVGYRQVWCALDRGSTGGLREQGVAATRQLAKRQLTWLRGMPSRQVLACDEPGVEARALQLLRRLATR